MYMYWLSSAHVRPIRRRQSGRGGLIRDPGCWPWAGMLHLSGSFITPMPGRMQKVRTRRQHSRENHNTDNAHQEDGRKTVAARASRPRPIIFGPPWRGVQPNSFPNSKIPAQCAMTHNCSRD